MTWVALDAERPLSLSMSVRFGSFDLPSEVAERLPKVLIHRNVPGEAVHKLMQAMDRAWLDSAPLAPFGFAFIPGEEPETQQIEKQQATHK